MKPAEIVELVKNEKPQLFQSLNDKQAAALVRSVLAEVGKAVRETEQGLVKVAGLGNFRVNVVEREKDGQKTSVKRVLFRAVEPKQAASEE